MATAAWVSEAAFFDKQAESAVIAPTPPSVVERYRSAKPGSAYPLEHAFGLMGDVRGRKVLDIGCGEGENSMILALLGAHVTGIDISPGAIRVCHRKAVANGVEGDFRIASVQDLVKANERFDVILCAAFLHHVIDDFMYTLAAIRKLLEPGGKLVIIEPIALSPTLRTVRKLLPSKPHTPGERPLHKTELNILRSSLPRVTMRYFRLLRGRAWNLDRTLLRLPFLGRFASVCVMGYTAPAPWIIKPTVPRLDVIDPFGNQYTSTLDKGYFATRGDHKLECWKVHG